MVRPEKSLTREELLEEMIWAIDAIRDLSSRGGEQRMKQDPQFRYAMAFLWLRLGEPANQLVRRRLVGDSTAKRWQYLSAARNQVAHERDQDIAYLGLWHKLHSALDETKDDVIALVS